MQKTPASLRVRVTAIWATVILACLASGTMAWLTELFRSYFRETLGGMPLPALSQFYFSNTVVLAYPVFFVIWALALTCFKPPSENDTLLFCGLCLCFMLGMMVFFGLSLSLPTVRIIQSL